ncbi:5906_t:CDS:2, partial [Acaulospora colombiana]
MSCTIVFFLPWIIAYLLFVLFDIAPENGGRRFSFARNASFWKWYAEYFPIKLIKRVDLDPSKNYIFGYHPHGVISVGAWTNFATEANDFSKKFPGITCCLLTLTSNFNFPLYRDYLMAQGLASVSRQSCENILHKGPGNSVMIVVGGAGESLNARPGVYDLVLKRRLGFIKLAVRNGACLCPVFSFGENDIWEQADNPKGGKVWKFQKTIWDTRTGDELMKYSDHQDFISDFAFRADTKTLVTASGDGTLSVCDIRRPNLIDMSDNQDDELLSVVIMKDNRKVVVGTQGGVI